MDHRDTQFIDKVVAAPAKTAGVLPFRPAVNIYQHRSLARKLLGIRAISKPGNRQAIEAFPAHQLGLHECGRIDARRFVARPAGELAGFDVDRIHVGRALRGGNSNGEIGAIAMPLDAAQRTERQFWRW